MLPISIDAMNGPEIVKNLVVVYAWTSELELAFEALVPLTKMPFGIDYGDLKVSTFWNPLRNDGRFEKLLAELTPRDRSLRCPATEVTRVTELRQARPNFGIRYAI
jgi:hypothetical protein